MICTVVVMRLIPKARPPSLNYLIIHLFVLMTCFVLLNVIGLSPSFPECQGSDEIHKNVVLMLSTLVPIGLC